MHSLNRCGVLVLAAGAVLLCGCASAYRLEDECESAPGCFDDAEVVCLDELASWPDDSACRTVEVETTSDDCAESAARLRVVRIAEGSASTWIESEILAAAPSAVIAGIFSPDESCRTPCDGGWTTDDTTPGSQHFQDRMTPGEIVVDELVLLGRGVRWRLSFCAMPP